MIKQTIHIVLQFVGFVLLQVWVLNNIHLFRVAELFLYIYVIVKFPTQMSRSQMVVTSFLLGFAIDMFSNTPGMHAAACSLTGFLRTGQCLRGQGNDRGCHTFFPGFWRRRFCAVWHYVGFYSPRGVVFD